MYMGHLQATDAFNLVLYDRHSVYRRTTSEFEVSDSYNISSLEPSARSCTNDTQYMCAHCSVIFIYLLATRLILPPACEIWNHKHILYCT